MKLSEPKKISLSSSVSFEKIDKEEGARLIEASSLDSLKKLFPAIKTPSDDLIKVSFNMAVANLVNDNGHGILGKDAQNCIEGFIHRPFNIEHCQSSVIGHAITYGFTTFGENEIIDKLTKKYTENLTPFNMALGGVVYKRADPYYAEFISESTDPKNIWYHKLSASWEVLYDEYIIALGSKKLADATLIWEDDKVMEYTPYLRDEDGGTGFLKDGTPVYRVIIGEGILPAGVGFTFTPAAEVKGMVSEDSASYKKTKSYSSQEGGGVDPLSLILENSQSSTETIKILSEEIKKIRENFSQSNTKGLSQERRMKIKEISDITEDSLKESTASEIRDFIKVQLAEKVSEAQAQEDLRKQELQAKEDEIKQKQTELEEKVNSLESLKSELEAVKTELSEVKAAKEGMEQQARFDERMTSIDEKFEVTDEQRTVIAKQVRSLGDEDFDAWLGDFEKFLVAKKSKGEKKPEKALSTASSKEDVPNAQNLEEGEESLAKYKKSFAKVTINV